MKILYHLISGQNSPNFIATKLIEPDLNVYFYTEDSKRQLDFLKNALPQTVSEEYCVEAFNYNNIHEIISRQIENHNSVEHILNFTGGTKIMSLSAFEVFKGKNLKSIYVDSQSHKLVTFSNNEYRIESYKTKISIEDYLIFNGHRFDIKENKLTIDEIGNRRKFYLFLENHFTEKIKKYLSEVNKKFYPAGNNDSKERKKNNEIISKDGKFKLIWKVTDKKCSIILNEEQFEINGNDSLKYITGYWFEDLVIEKKFLNNKFFDDFKKGVHIKDKNTNQDIIDIDVAAIKGDTLYIYELKSGKPQKEAANNLKTIKEQIGKYVKPHLISYIQIPDNDPLKQRFDDLNIKCYKYSEFNLENAKDKSNPNL